MYYYLQWVWRTLINKQKHSRYYEDDQAGHLEILANKFINIIAEAEQNKETLALTNNAKSN